MEKIDDIEKDKLKESAPKLFSMKKENPFDVPEGYFDNLSNDISEKCFHSDNKKITPIRNNSFQKILIPLAIAASIIIFILIFYKENKNEITTADQYAYNEKNNVSEYLNDLIDKNELDESLIVSELVKDDTAKSDPGNRKQNIDNNVNTVNATDSINSNIVTKDDIIQYLIENDELDDLLNY